MKTHTIMLVCSAGMSTSLLVSKMEKAAAAKEIDADIFAVSASDADNYLAKKDVDVLMLGPQVRYMLKQFEKKLEGTNIEVAVIDMKDYGMVDGEKVLNTAISKIK